MYFSLIHPVRGICKTSFTQHYQFSLSSDVDECAEATHNCHQFASCTNTVGHFTCKCIDGYTGNGKICQGTLLFSDNVLCYIKSVHV